MSLRLDPILDGGDGERVAWSLVHGAFAAVRGLETLVTFGLDVPSAAALAGQIRTAQTSDELDDALTYLEHFRSRNLRSRAGADQVLGGTTDDDQQGERQIGYDEAAWTEMQQIAEFEHLVLVGEEDDFRRAGGAVARGARLAEAIMRGERFAIADPLDGSNQAAGMGQRSGWACCALVVDSTLTEWTVALLLGDGRGFVSTRGEVWFSESTHPDRARISYRLEPNVATSAFDRPHFVIPASKRSSLVRAHQILDQDLDIGWIAPLGGNPGMVAAMLGGSAVAAMQPSAYAWDHMAALLLATAGFVVLRSRQEEPVEASELLELLLADMVGGRKTETLYVGRTREFAERLRRADRASSP